MRYSTSNEDENENENTAVETNNKTTTTTTTTTTKTTTTVYKDVFNKHRRKPDNPLYLDDINDMVDFSSANPLQHENVIDLSERRRRRRRRRRPHNNISTNNSHEHSHEHSYEYQGPIYGLKSHPGFAYIPCALSPSLQRDLVYKAVTEFCEPPHGTNIDLVPIKDGVEVENETFTFHSNHFGSSSEESKSESMWELWKRENRENIENIENMENIDLGAAAADHDDDGGDNGDLEVNDETENADVYVAADGNSNSNDNSTQMKFSTSSSNEEERIKAKAKTTCTSKLKQKDNRGNNNNTRNTNSRNNRNNKAQSQNENSGNNSAEKKSKKKKKYYKSFEKLSWATLGYRFDWTARAYREKNKSAMPKILDILGNFFARLGEETKEITITQTADTNSNSNSNSTDNNSTDNNSADNNSTDNYTFTASAAIVNYYSLKSSMGGHRDDSELDVTKPVVSFSLGLPAVFLIGGKTRDEGPVVPLLLRPGDVMLLGGDSRLNYHGVARILCHDLVVSKSKLLPAVGSCIGGYRVCDFQIKSWSSLLAGTRSIGGDNGNANDNVNYSDIIVETPPSDRLAIDAFLLEHRVNANVRQVLPDGLDRIPGDDDDDDDDDDE